MAISDKQARCDHKFRIYQKICPKCELITNPTAEELVDASRRQSSESIIANCEHHWILLDKMDLFSRIDYVLICDKCALHQVKHLIKD